ncbi:MAG TPA: thymidine phosphorylase [Anaerolineales bacterium]|nr:thymidine phosphorylase [Anaerolineales bacterium]
MRAVDIITRKRDGHELTRQEIEYFVDGFARGEIPDYQASAWAMAVLFRGMTARETYNLTLAMVATGETLDLSRIAPHSVDKHSTGGVGDKTTLVVEPTVAACGVPVAKMSGRGLGYSGGTLDKLESIPGFRVSLTTEQFLDQLARIGLVLCGQTADLAPADGKLYALRDVTGTVPSLPLIAASVMSKKLASGAKGIVLDVKVGSGAFMATVPEALELARRMVDIGRWAGRKVVALISDMNQPLGQAVGNALELQEALDTLRGGGPRDFREHCLRIAAHMLIVAGKARDLRASRLKAVEAIRSGAALGKFRDLVKAQGGDVTVVDHPDRLPAAPSIQTIPSPRSGYLRRVDARTVGEVSVALGAGRERKGDPIDHRVGIIVHHKVGDSLEAGEPLFTVHSATAEAGEAAGRALLKGVAYSRRPVAPLPLFYRTLRS